MEQLETETAGTTQLETETAGTTQQPAGELQFLKEQLTEEQRISSDVPRTKLQKHPGRVAAGKRLAKWNRRNREAKRAQNVVLAETTGTLFNPAAVVKHSADSNEEPCPSSEKEEEKFQVRFLLFCGFHCRFLCFSSESLLQQTRDRGSTFAGQTNVAISS